MPARTHPRYIVLQPELIDLRPRRGQSLSMDPGSAVETQTEAYSARAVKAPNFLAGDIQF